jgi:hypothetical protein
MKVSELEAGKDYFAASGTRHLGDRRRVVVLEAKMLYSRTRKVVDAPAIPADPPFDPQTGKANRPTPEKWHHETTLTIERPVYYALGAHGVPCMVAQAYNPEAAEGPETRWSFQLVRPQEIRDTWTNRKAEVQAIQANYRKQKADAEARREKNQAIATRLNNLVGKGTSAVWVTSGGLQAFGAEVPEYAIPGLVKLLDLAELAAFGPGVKADQ